MTACTVSIAAFCAVALKQRLTVPAIGFRNVVHQARIDSPCLYGCGKRSTGLQELLYRLTLEQRIRLARRSPDTLAAILDLVAGELVGLERWTGETE